MATRLAGGGARRLDNRRGSESTRAFSKVPRRGGLPVDWQIVRSLLATCNGSQAATGRTNRLLKFWLQAAQKDPEARRAKIDELRRTYSTLQRGDLKLNEAYGSFSATC